MTPPEETFRPYRRLAERIIALALRDARDGSQSQGQSARAFLAGSSMLDLWCQVANLDAQCIAARAVALRKPAMKPADRATCVDSLTS